MILNAKLAQLQQVLSIANHQLEMEKGEKAELEFKYREEKINVEALKEKIKFISKDLIELQK